MKKKPSTVCTYCGFLNWTVERYGQVLHKHECPHKTDRCQTHPKGCPTGHLRLIT